MSPKRFDATFWAKATAFIVMATMATLGGCDCDNDHNRAQAPAIPEELTTGSGLFVVECNIMKAYVPLLNSSDPDTGNGRVAVIDLSVDPNTTDPQVATVVLSHQDDPTGSAADPDDELIIVVSGRSGSGGFVDLIDWTTDTLTSDSPIAIPTGSEPGGFGQVLWDPIRKVAIISVTSNSSCTDDCEGFITFDPATRAFGSVIPANYAETFAFNAATNVVIDASDDDSGHNIGLVDLDAGQNCILSDDNIGAGPEGNDNDGAAVDFNTNIAVISNEDSTATVVNLNGSTFSGTAPACVVNEGGTPPNSVLVTGLDDVTGCEWPDCAAGSALNPVTHEAFLVEDENPGITLLTLPSSPVTQIDSSMVTKTLAEIPDNPEGSSFDTQGDPYAVAYDVCNDVAYAVDDSSRWLVGVDIASMKADPGAINDALPAGNCAGTTTTLACTNGSGVTYFPLPPFTED